MDTKEIAKHVKMIQTPEDWPAWPALPLKRHDGKIDAAVILAQRPYYERTGPIRVFLTNMFNGVDASTPCVDFLNAEAIIEAGWKVD